MYRRYEGAADGLGRTPDGWFDTGDVGSIDAAARFSFAGRTKDLLRVKGINVSPVEVETTLADHPAVESAYVVGLPADSLDQRIVALIVAVDECERPEVGDLSRWASERLSHYKRPEGYVFIDRSDVVLGPTSKPQRDRLAALATMRGA